MLPLLKLLNCLRSLYFFTSTCLQCSAVNEQKMKAEDSQVQLCSQGSLSYCTHRFHGAVNCGIHSSKNHMWHIWNLTCENMLKSHVKHMGNIVLEHLRGVMCKAHFPCETDGITCYPHLHNTPFYYIFPTCFLHGKFMWLFCKGDLWRQRFDMEVNTPHCCSS